MTPKQELATSILTTWSLIAAHSGTDEAIDKLVADQDVVAVKALARLEDADPQDVARAASVLADGMRREALAIAHRVRARAQVEGLTPPLMRLAMHDELRVQNLSTITARHLVMVSKVNGDLNPQQTRQAMVTRLAVARANGLAGVAVRQATRNFTSVA